MKQYLDQLRHILDNGSKRDDRTGTGTIGVFGLQARYDLTKGFPAVTTKKLFMKGIVYELLWILRGDTNIKYLVDNGVHIWDDDAYRKYLKQDPEHPLSKDQFVKFIKENNNSMVGNLGPIYGAQWRKWRGKDRWGCYDDEDITIDQVANLIDGIKNNPYSRRHIVSAWNVTDISRMILPPCHCLAQFYVNDGKLSCQMYQRSADMFLGAPFNIAGYALLTHMIAQVCGLGVGDFIHSIGDAHIYLNHLDQVKEQLTRDPLELSRLWLNPDIKNIDDFKFDDVKLENYTSHKKIKAPISVG